MNRKSLALLFGTLAAIASPAFADSISFSSSAVSATTLNPSSDIVTINPSDLILPGPGPIVFQSGDIYIGDSPISDQVIPFFFYDTVSINGVSKTLTIFGQDNVTSSADFINISAGLPVNFGSFIFTLDASSYTGSAVGQVIPLQLSGTVAAAPTPEPATLCLLATGLLGGAFFFTRDRRLQLSL